jgi:hypothetical protein
MENVSLNDVKKISMKISVLALWDSLTKLSVTKNIGIFRWKRMYDFVEDAYERKILDKHKA